MEDEDKYNISEAASSYRHIEDGQGSVVSSLVDVNIPAKKASVSVGRKSKIVSDEVKPKIIPPPGTGQKIYEIDPSLLAHRDHLDFRYGQYKRLCYEIDKHEGGLDTFSRGYEKFGFIRSTWWCICGPTAASFQQQARMRMVNKVVGISCATGITYREWAPGAKLTGCDEGRFQGRCYGVANDHDGRCSQICRKEEDEIVPPGTSNGSFVSLPLLTSIQKVAGLTEGGEDCANDEDCGAAALRCGFLQGGDGEETEVDSGGFGSAALIGDFNNWNPNADVMTRNEFGVWEIFLPNNVDGSPPIPHGSRVKIRMDTPSGIKDSIPAWIKFSVQAPGEIPYSGIYYDPPEEEKYVFKHPQPKRPKSLRIYESHIGMSSPGRMENAALYLKEVTNNYGLQPRSWEFTIPEPKILNWLMEMWVENNSYFTKPIANVSGQAARTCGGFNVVENMLWSPPMLILATAPPLPNPLNLTIVAITEIRIIQRLITPLPSPDTSSHTEASGLLPAEPPWVCTREICIAGLEETERRSRMAFCKMGLILDLMGQAQPCLSIWVCEERGSLFGPQADGDTYRPASHLRTGPHLWYHVTNFFAPSSRFGTPEELKSLIDRAHELGLLVLMDIVHSHASNNTLDGLNMFDGTDGHYFHPGSRGYHWMWDSRLFNYGSWEVLRYLLSNARWWLDEYKFDGFRFDGVTSMMYTHHGLEVAFTGNYNEYFGFATDVDAVVYLMLTNDVIHGLFPEAVTIGEDVSGMPTFCLPTQDGGIGFDYRLHMAIADKWIEILKKNDEDWKMGDIIHTLTNRRWLEKCVAYAESHDQALVGDKTIAFWLMDKDMYDFMALDRPSTPIIDRGIALHKMIRLITMGLGGEGYLNFMGNEFGHPEWIDFPRGDQHLPNGVVVPGNNNSFDKCRRRFDLGDADYLRYQGMQEFDQAMQHLEEKFGFMTAEHQYISRKNEGDKIIVFERGNLIFVFNFHWTNSYSDYRVGCSTPGKYKIVLDSDDALFGGFSRLNHAAEYFTSVWNFSKLVSECAPCSGMDTPSVLLCCVLFVFPIREGWYDDRPRSFLIYAPSRTAVVYALADEAEPALADATEPEPVDLDDKLLG
ncbi:hypothetical protein JHK82_054089 [Glycine max]|nr:hypothetical protein JHK86_053937 [Glycine max]KAG4916440.1 hypothetical protein JHK87_053997 [Glycine soja]KAG4928407.1 hypothetical protein JHK85_054893 [Glycine max]KAG5083924.1 hypothetical protein JHK84_053962 [Glycine max]KAG5086692.1 hypothetical protein JHK82_054089 [Glycine max]